MYAEELVVLLVVTALVGVPWLVLRELVGHPRAEWRAAGLTRARWIALVVAVPVVGAALYLRHARPRLRGRGTPG